MTNAWSLLYDHMNNENDFQALDEAYNNYLDKLNSFEFQTAVPVTPEQQKQNLTGSITKILLLKM
jgi:hypothetical protein